MSIDICCNGNAMNFKNVPFYKDTVVIKTNFECITDVNKIYFEQNLLKVLQLGRGFAWLDTGTNDSMQAAGDFVSTIQKRQGLQIACLEEIAFKNGWIDKEILSNQIKKYINSDYGRYLQKLIV